MTPSVRREPGKPVALDARATTGLALLYLFAGCGLYWVQHQSLHWVVGAGLQVGYFGFLAPALALGGRRLGLCHMAMFFAVFHQYAADPYSDSFANLLSGPGKFVALAVCLYLVWGTRWKETAVMTLLFLGACMAAVTVLSRPTEPQYLAQDVLAYTLLALVVAYRPVEGSVRGDVLRAVLFRYATLLPVAYVFVGVAGLSYEVAGSTYYFYGHLFGFLVVWASFVAFLDGGSRLWEKISLMISLVLWLPLAQSEHVVLALLLLLYLSAEQGRFRTIFVTVVAIAMVVALALVAEPGSWTALKVSQVVSLVLLDLDGVNSLAIRVASLQNILSGNSIVQHLVGNGLGATHGDWGYFGNVFLHERTFPVEQLESGRYFLIHAAPVKLFFNLGLLGVLSIGVVAVLRVVGAAGRRPSDGVPVLFFFFFWHASIQASMLLALFSLIVAADTVPARRRSPSVPQGGEDPAMSS